MSEIAAGRYPRPYIAEMGGKNPTIVTEKADLDRAAAGIARSAYGMGGQKCSALSRLYVHEKVADELLSKIEKEIDKIRIGDPTERATGLGPVVNKRAQRLRAHVAELKDRGAKIPAARKQRRRHVRRGYYVEPCRGSGSVGPLWSREFRRS